MRQKDLKKIEKLHESVNFEYLIYHFKGSPENIYFNHFTDAETLFDDTKPKRTRFEEEENNQMKF